MVAVLAFIHEHPDDIPLGKSEQTDELREKLEAFRQSLSQNRIVKFWREAAELPGLVSLSLSRAIKMSPAVGWVRANKVANEELLTQLNDVRIENEGLKKQVVTLKSQVASDDIQNLASMNEPFTLKLAGQARGRPRREPMPTGKEAIEYPAQVLYEHKITWEAIFSIICSLVLIYPRDSVVKSLLDTKIGSKVELFGQPNLTPGSLRLSDIDFDLIRTQFLAQQLIMLSKDGDNLIWSLTEKGKKLACELLAVKAATKSG